MGFSRTFHVPFHHPWWWGSGGPAADIVPWQLPCAINDHAYMMDFAKTRFTTMQIRRVSADDSVEPGEQTLSAAGVWPRAQDNYFLGAGQEFLDNRFAFESVYVHSGEYPSVRTRFWKSQGIDPWKEGKFSLLPEYTDENIGPPGMKIVMCGNHLYVASGATLSFENVPDFESTEVTSANAQPITSITSDGSRVWFACGSDGVFVTEAGTTTSVAAATPAALNGIGGLLAYSAGAGTVIPANLPNGPVTYHVSEVDPFGNETAAVSVTVVVASLPINLNWNPDTAANFNVYRGPNLVYTGDVPSFVDDGTVVGTVKGYPTLNDTGSTPYPATYIQYGKGHLIGSTGPDLVEILASGAISFIYQSENPSFVFNCGCELPSAIIVAGNSNSLAFIGALQPDTTNVGATLAPPTWASSLPYGETINAIAYNAGSILLGTSLGVRTGTDANSNGVFNINPVIEDPGPVLCVQPWAQYMYFGWSNYAPAEPWALDRPTKGGLGRADLSQYTTAGVPAYASDVMGLERGITTQVVVANGVPYFVTEESGVSTLWAPDGNVVTSGWIEPGWIRYGTLENKITVEVDFQHKPLPVGASVQYQIVGEDEQTVHDIGINTSAGSTTLVDPLDAGLRVGDRFMPIITLVASDDGTQGPTFLSHVTKAMVTTKRQDEILLALVWAEKVRTLGASAKTLNLDCLNELLYLKHLEKTGQVIKLTLGRVELRGYIDQVMQEPTDEVTAQRAWFMGTVTVKIITLSDYPDPFSIV